MPSTTITNDDVIQDHIQILPENPANFPLLHRAHILNTINQFTIHIPQSLLKSLLKTSETIVQPFQILFESKSIINHQHRIDCIRQTLSALQQINSPPFLLHSKRRQQLSNQLFDLLHFLQSFPEQTNILPEQAYNKLKNIP